MEKMGILRILQSRSKQLVYTVVAAFLTAIFGDRKRKYAVGFGPVEIPPGETKNVSAQPQALFRGQRIINTLDSDEMYVQGLFVGHKPQLPTLGNAIALACFDSSVDECEMQFDECDPALYITFQIQNASKEPKKFAATIIGEVRSPIRFE